MGLYRHIFLTPTLHESEWWLDLRHWVGGWVIPRVSVDIVDKKEFVPDSSVARSVA
jgi:hypothetical protein